MTIKEQAVSDAMERIEREIAFQEENPRGICATVRLDDLRTILSAMNAASHPLEQQQAVSGQWQPIETAPKDALARTTPHNITS